MKKGRSKPLSPEQLAELKSLAALSDDAIDTSDAPEVLDWSGAKRGLFYRPVKQQITLRLDADVVAWFKAQATSDKGYQTGINRALREYAQLISSGGSVSAEAKPESSLSQADRTWYQFAEKLVSTGYLIFGHAEVPVSERGASDPRVLAVLFLCRTIHNLEGAALLAREKMVVEARILTRCCYENLFFVAALRDRGDEFVREIFRDDIANRQSRGEFLLQWKSRLTNAEWEPRLRAFLKELRRKSLKGKRLTPKDIAHGGAVEAAYMFYTQLSVDAAHPTTDALARFLVRFEENGKLMRGIDVNPTPRKNEISATLDLACQAALGVFVGVNEIITSKEADWALRKVIEEYQILNGIASAGRE